MWNEEPRCWTMASIREPLKRSRTNKQESVNPSKSPPLSHTTTAVHHLHLWSLTRGGSPGRSLCTLSRAMCESVRRGLSWRQRRGPGFSPDHSWRTGLHSGDGRCRRFDSLKLKHKVWNKRKVLQLRYCVSCHLKPEHTQLGGFTGITAADDC